MNVTDIVTPECEFVGASVVFRLRDLKPSYHAAARDLGFVEAQDGFIRTFPASAPNLQQVCANFRSCAAAMLLQTARVEPVPWESGLLLWLERLSGTQIDWFLGGSAALAVRGMPIVPRDFDIITDGAGAHRLGELFADVMVEPVAPVEEWISHWFGRAFLKARFEWVGDVRPEVDAPLVSDFGPVAASQLETIDWRGYQIRVPPLELQLAVCERRRLTERAEAIRDLLRAE